MADLTPTDDMYDIARRVTDETLGEGTYAEMNRGNPDPGVQAAIRRAAQQEPLTPGEARLQRARAERVGDHVLVNLAGRAESDLREAEHESVSSRVPARMLLSAVTELQERRAAERVRRDDCTTCAGAGTVGEGAPCPDCREADRA